MEWPRSGTGMAGWCQRSFEVSDCRHGRGCLGLEGGFSWEGNHKKSRDETGDGKIGRYEEDQGSHKTGTGEEGGPEENCSEKSDDEESSCEAGAESGSSCTSY
ncbi:hypothetical protein V4C53_40760 [Paraburkholderia azotifigens]